MAPRHRARKESQETREYFKIKSKMRLFWAFLLLASSAAALPNPQLLDTVDDGYGGGEQQQQQQQQHGAPASTLVDDTSHSCSDYLEDGYECVPYDLCFDGEIVVDGGGLIDIR